MFLTFSVLSISAVVLSACLLGLVCRHHPDMWIASDDVILCLVTPVLIIFSTFGGIAMGYRITHGGIGAIPVEGWISSAIIVGVAIGIWSYFAPRIRNEKSLPTGAASAST